MDAHGNRWPESGPLPRQFFPHQILTIFVEFAHVLSPDGHRPGKQTRVLPSLQMWDG